MSSPSPIPGTASPTEPLDAEGADERHAFTVQVRVFAGLALFLVALSVGYGIWTREYAGTTLLLLTAGLTGLNAVYLWWRRPLRTAGEASTGEADDEPWFPVGSIWPFAIGVGVVLVGNGLLLGLWLFLPSVVVLAAAVWGFAGQSRRR